MIQAVENVLGRWPDVFLTRQKVTVRMPVAFLIGWVFGRRLRPTAIRKEVTGCPVAFFVGPGICLAGHSARSVVLPRWTDRPGA